MICWLFIDNTMADIRVVYWDTPDHYQRKLVRNGKILTTIQGIIYHKNYKEIITRLEIGTQVILKPEPDNPYDCNAIAVYWENDRIGYVAKKDIPAIMPCVSDDGTIAVIDKIADNFIGIYVHPTFTFLGKRNNKGLPELTFAVYTDLDEDPDAVYNEKEFKDWYKYKMPEQFIKSSETESLNTQLDRMKEFLLDKLKNM